MEGLIPRCYVKSSYVERSMLLIMYHAMGCIKPWPFGCMIRGQGMVVNLSTLVCGPSIQRVRRRRCSSHTRGEFWMHLG